MGKSAANPDIEFVTDYATNETFVRLHLDVMVSAEVLETAQEYMNAQQPDKAIETLKKATDYRYHAFLDQFFARRLAVQKTKSVRAA